MYNTLVSSPASWDATEIEWSPGFRSWDETLLHHVQAGHWRTHVPHQRVRHQVPLGSPSLPPGLLGRGNVLGVMGSSGVMRKYVCNDPCAKIRPMGRDLTCCLICCNLLPTCGSSRASVTRHHKPGSLTQEKFVLVALTARSPKSKCRWGCFLPEARESVPFCAPASGGASSPGCSAAHITPICVPL